MDIIFDNYGSESVDAFYGNGDETFELMTTFSTGAGSGPYLLATGDINHHGRLNIVAGNASAKTISIVFGKLLILLSFHIDICFVSHSLLKTYDLMELYKISFYILIIKTLLNYTACCIQRHRNMIGKLSHIDSLYFSIALRDFCVSSIISLVVAAINRILKNY